jgi:drug/metabolite transporter (DMT)-like permease
LGAQKLSSVSFFVTLILIAALSITGQVMLKSVSQKMKFDDPIRWISALVLSINFYLAVVLLGASFMCYAYLLRFHSLTYVLSMLSLGYLVALIVDIRFFSIPVRPGSIIGVVCIVIGVFLVHRNAI